MTRAEQPILDCAGLRKAYGAGARRLEVLKDVELRAQAGELLFVLGPSGSGKSTLLSILAGLLAPDGGSIQLCGRDIARLSRSQRVRLRGSEIGVAPQRHHLLPALSARENAALGLIVRGTSRRAAIAEAERGLAALGLADWARSKPRALSVGQRQRVAIARALAPDPRLLLCDEPTAALDCAGAATLMALLRDEAGSRRRATIIVTHDETLPQAGERVLCLTHGRLRPRSLGEVA